jgi:hypothetical protein
MLLRFTYNHPPEGIDDDTGEKFKEILVLHPNWMRRVHAIDLKRLTTAEREVLSAILDKEQVKAAKAGKKPHRFPLVNDVLRRMDPLEEIKNPVSFYARFVKVFLRNKDAYRTYDPVRMSSVTVVKNTDVTGKQINPKPLFGERNVFAPSEPKKTEPTRPTAGPEKKPSRMDLIRQRADQMKKKGDL